MGTGALPWTALAILIGGLILILIVMVMMMMLMVMVLIMKMFPKKGEGSHPIKNDFIANK